jgi:hypothetical protein
LRALFTDSTGRVQHSRPPRSRESEHVAQDQYGELARWQDLEGGHEGQGWTQSARSGLRGRAHGDRAVEERVGIWLEARRPRRVESARALDPGCPTTLAGRRAG